MEDDYVCEYDSTWDTESDGDDPAGESQSRRSTQDKNKSSWAIVGGFITKKLDLNSLNRYLVSFISV